MCFKENYQESESKKPTDCKEPLNGVFDDSPAPGLNAEAEGLEASRFDTTKVHFHLMGRVDSLEKTDAGRDWGQEKKGTTEDEMAGWHH